MSFDLDTVCVAGQEWSGLSLPDRASREFLLVPALMFQVLVPERQWRELNIFQSGVFGLRQSGIQDVEELAARLHLDRTLIDRVINELTQLRYLTRDGQPTRGGTTAYEDDEAGPSAVRYVFQDPFMGELWPAVLDQPMPAPVLLSDAAFEVDLPKANGAKVSRISGPLGEMPARPTPAEVVAVSVRYSTDRSALLDDAFDLDPDLDIGEGVEQPHRRVIGRVSFIDPDPVPVYLLTYVWVPPRPNDVEGICSFDPFNPRRSLFLDKLIFGPMRNDRAMVAAHRRLDVTMAKEKLGGHRAYLREVAEQARGEIERRLGELTSRLGENFGALLEFQVCILGMQLDEERASKLLEQAAVEAQKALEGLLSALLRANVFPKPLEVAIRAMRGKGKGAPDVMGPMFRDIASIGFVDVPEKIRAQGADQIVSALKFNGSLRGYVVTLMFSAYQDLSHPLRRIAVSNPAFLQELDLVAEMRNKSAHADRDFSHVNSGALVEATYNVARSVLEDIASTGE